MSLESFISGFIGSCQKAGMSVAQTEKCLDTALALTEKKADDSGGIPGLSAVGGAIGGIAKGIGKTVGNWALPLYVGAPAAAGAGIGYAASRMQELGEDDIDDVRRREMIDNYRRLASEMEVRAKSRPQPQYKARSPIMR
jgi:hypothetical protein